MNPIIIDRFKDKVMIITGAAGGIGKAVAVRAAKEGAKLVLADRKEEMSKETLKEIQKITPQVEFVVTDLAIAENCKNVIDVAMNRFGTIDILVNNAGITGTPAPVHEMSEEMMRNVIDCNIMSAFFCSHYAIPNMINHGKGGAVVNVASVAGITGFPGNSAYVTSKHGLNGLTKNMALDYAKYGITVNSVNPATTDTPMYYEALEFLKKKRQEAAEKGESSQPSLVSGKIQGPQNRIAKPEEIADIILFLVSPEASNVTGCIMATDGGFTAY